MACALVLGAAGVRVAVNYYGDEELADEVVRQIESEGGQAFAHRALPGQPGSPGR